jgi:membrane dipeptidase
MEMLDKFYMELEENKQDICIARNYSEMAANDAQGKISAFLAIEEGGTLKGELHHLRNFYRLGVRLITLTWNFPNEIGYPNYEWKHQNKGLTERGREIVCEMNRLGMIIDVAHLSDQGFYDVAALSNKPFTASHSNARAMTGHARNLTDDMIKMLSNKGGIMGLNFERTFLVESGACDITDMVLHAKHIKNVGGIEVLAIGGDLDGTINQAGISDIGEIDILMYALKKDGFTENEIESIFYKNAVRLISDTL